MNAPSELHENRVRLLEDLADLAGFYVKTEIYHWRLRPDVCRLHRHGRAIVVADAKARETPTDLATRHRLVRYAAASRLWARAGVVVTFAICHDTDLAGRWSEVLASCLATAGHGRGRTSYAEIDGRTAVSAITVVHGSRPDFPLSGLVTSSPSPTGSLGLLS